MKATDLAKYLAGEVIYKETTGSTNDDAKETLRQGAANGTVVVAGSQTSGKGRQEKSFFSPDTGVYFSVILRPKTLSDTSLYTIYAALATSRAAEKLYGITAGIKWVNDLFVDGKKCAGILTEAVTAADGKLQGVVVGIGVNVFYPDGGFPSEIAAVAGALTEKIDDNRAEFIGEIVNNLLTACAADDKEGAIDEYRRRLIVLGKKIVVTEPCGVYRATAENIDCDGRLIITTDDGVRKTLCAGDVSVCAKE